MDKPTTRWDRRGIIAAAVTAVLVLLGGGLVFAATRGPGPPPQPPLAAASAAASATTAASAAPSSAPGGSPSPTSTLNLGPLMVRSEPVALRIPAIGVNVTGIVDLGLDSRGKLQPPKDFGHVGWYTGGAAPGEFGPAVLGGHVDSKSGPAVFYRLGALRKGDTVQVTRADKSVARFVIDKVGRYAKADFPTTAVYGNTTDRAEIRLITCGGAFDQATGHYVDNIVVFGHLVA